MKIIKQYFFLLLVFAFAKLYSQTGDYFIQNYLPKDYKAGANNFGIAQDNNGIIFIANLNGVLIFDGINWQHCKRRDEVAIQCVTKTSKGEIMVGTEDGDIAIIEKNKKGKFEYVSLIEHLPVKNRPKQIIRQIINLGESTFFLSADKLIEYKKSEFKAYNPTENFNARAFVMGKHLFVSDMNNAINVLENGVLKPVLNSEELSSEKFFFCYKLNVKEFIVGFRNIGTVQFNYDSINPTKSTFYKKQSNCNDEILSAEINNGCQLKNGNYIITTNKKGAVEINNQLNIVQRYNANNGIYDDNIKSAFQDANGNLWLALYYGVSFVEINSRLLKYNRNNNILGVVSSATYFENKLFVATDKGVQYYDSLNQKFLTFENFNYQTWRLLNFNNKLFICSAKGLFVLTNNQLKQISESNTNCIINDVYQPNLIYCGTESGVDVFFVSPEKVTFVKSYNLISPVKSLATDIYKNIYFSTETNGIYFLNYNNSYLLDSIKQNNGLPNDEIENYVFTFNNKLLIGTDSGIYTVNKIKNNKITCIKHPEFWSLTKNSQVFRGAQIGVDLICTQKTELKEIDKTTESVNYFEAKKSNFKSNTSVLSHLKDITSTLIQYDSSNKVAFICANEGLFLLNNKTLNSKRDFKIILTQFSCANDTLIQNYLPYSANSKKLDLTIPFDKNEINIKLGFTCYENSNFEFSYKLIGKDNIFSNWSKESKIKFNNLFEGNYTLIVRAKTELSANNYEIQIPFIVTPPWYRTYYAYFIYLVLFGLFIWLIIKLNSKRLIAQNKKLEQIIVDRTSVITEQKVELEHKQKEIIDSINYAERIQLSFMATKNFLDTHLKPENYFIFFKPKDIVSGDFYWSTKITDEGIENSAKNSKFVFCTADSTGHGVPGAIMSLLNITSIEKAIEKETLPNKILNATRINIINRLKNDGSSEGGKDGMDCSLCVYDFKKLKLYVAAANNPVWIVRGVTEHNLLVNVSGNNQQPTTNKQIIEIKPDKMPVGRHDKQDTSFTLHEIDLKKGDIVYTITDGFPDQFGGENLPTGKAGGKKFMSKNLRELLVKNAHLSLAKQKELLETTFNTWKGNIEQIDDVTIVGIKI